jgi:hypothetical protein
MIRAGIAQTIAMKRTGRKTDRMFRRYNIVSAEDQLDAAKRLREYRATRPAATNVVGFGHKPDTSVSAGAK